MSSSKCMCGRCSAYIQHTGAEGQCQPRLKLRVTFITESSLGLVCTPLTEAEDYSRKHVHLPIFTYTPADMTELCFPTCLLAFARNDRRADFLSACLTRLFQHKRTLRTRPNLPLIMSKAQLLEALLL